MRGLPDWSRPLASGDWAAFESGGATLALPDTLAVATGPDGLPAFHLSAFRPLVPMPGHRGYGRLDLELRLDASRATPDGSVRAVPALRGALRLSSEALSLPAELADATELDCSGLGLARLMLPLRSEGVAVIERALADGAAPLLATVDIEIAGVAARVDGHATIDIAKLRAALAPGITPAELAERCAVDPVVFGILLSEVAPEVLPGAMGAAVADHVRAMLCDGPLRPRADGRLALVLAETGMATGTATLDLAAPVPATRAQTIMLDPFAMARDLTASRGGIATLVTRSTSAMLQSGQHEIVIDAAIARPCVGPLAFGARLVFPARPPARTHEVREDFELPADGGSVARRIRLAPNEPVQWTLIGYAFWPTADGRGVERLEGAAQSGTDTSALLRPADFPLHFVEVEAGQALLALASVEVALGAASATLTVAMPRAALAVPATADAPPLTATAVTREGSSVALQPSTGDRRFDLFDVPGYGAHEVEISVALPPGEALRAVEVLADDAAVEDEAETYAFTPATPARTHRWFCRDPFRPGLRWRWRGDAAFSAPFTGPRLDLAPAVAAA